MITLIDMNHSCVRCGAPAGTLMAFSYDQQTVWLADLTAEVTPGAGYAMCEDHAGRMTPPVGWTLIDRRSTDRPLFASLEVA